MSERLPYEQQLQQQWTDIPLPDENAAWDDMARRLKEDDDDKGIVFWWRPGCGLPGVLLLVILGLGWWILKPEKQFVNNGGDTGKQVITKVARSTKAKDRKETDKQANPKIHSGSKGKKSSFPERRTQKNNTWRGEDKGLVRMNTTRVDTTGMNTIKQDTSTVQDAPTVTKATDTTHMIDTPADASLKKDSVKKSRPPSAAKKEPPATENSDKNKFFFSTGLSLQQQLPIAGQKPTPYSSTGRKGSLADYIPSVYARLNKKDKWFLQAEFRYGAPQYSKEVTYHQASIPDTGSNPRYVTNSTARLKKTFYHQLPITFNHYVLPNWSVGGGVIWNKFYAALSDQETIKHDNINQTNTVVFKGLVSIKEDTSGTFASSYFQAVIESQYKWKRFSFGARYAFGLQPYIRFTLPGLGTKEEKNSSLQLFLRFDLWRPRQQ